MYYDLKRLILDIGSKMYGLVLSLVTWGMTGLSKVTLGSLDIVVIHKEEQVFIFAV